MPQKQVDDHWTQHFDGCADFKKTACCIGIAKHGSARCRACSPWAADAAGAFDRSLLFPLSNSFPAANDADEDPFLCVTGYGGAARKL
jgi:hypothetical protein